MEFTDKKILVTGITGTLGESVAKRFLKEGAAVRGLIRNETDILKYQAQGFTPVIGELANRDSLRKAAKDIDIIIHCAAYLGDNINLAIDSNITGVDNLASIALEAKVKKFIHISTLSVYGEPKEGFFDETSPITPEHDEVYVSTKAKSEQILTSYIKKGLDLVILRPGAICAEVNSWWGDRQVQRMLKTETVDWVHPDDIVPWVHTDNLVEMIHLVLSKDVSNQVYNTIDGNFPELDFRIRLVSALGKKLKQEDRVKEVAIFSNTKIKELGYQPIKTFEQTISNLERIGLNQLKE